MPYNIRLPMTVYHTECDMTCSMLPAITSCNLESCPYRHAVAPVLHKHSFLHGGNTSVTCRMIHAIGKSPALLLERAV